ncbi:MAG TPA: serine hydrolase domain-containing protein [Candidatus Baltobacteraceae bacterium]|nr:serine hydrolase domain-containing protein [Candidatus Baltobacteraceae bacterium]
MHTKIAAGVLAPLLCLGVAVAGAATAAPVIPNTVAGRAVTEMLAAFDSGNRETMKRFYRTHEPQRVKQLDDELAFRRMTGGFDLRKVEKSTPTEITVLVQERLSDRFARLTLHVKPGPPYRIASGSSLSAIDRPAEFALPHLSQAELVSQAKAYAQRLTAADQFAGTVLVASGEAPLLQEAYGLADRASKTPNTLDTRFRIGSMNKMFTATSIMQLVQAGKIGLDEPLGTYLTNYPNTTVSSQVTIRQLLTHTGGTGDIFGPEFRKHRLRLRTLQDYVDLYGNRPLRFKPGTKWEYSNYGFILLGAVIEKVSGESYYDYVREHVYAPAGMTSTGSQPEDVTVPDRSVGYTSGPAGDWRANTDTLPYRGTSAGGGYSTVRDLLAFARALQRHTLLDAKYTRMMTSAQTSTPFGDTYGFGFGQRTIDGSKCFGHSGGAPGMNGDLEICGNGYVIAVLSNLDPPAAERVSAFIANRLPLP